MGMGDRNFGVERKIFVAGGGSFGVGEELFEGKGEEKRKGGREK